MYEKDREEIIAEKMYKDIVLRRIEDYRKVLENEACNFVGDAIDEAVIKMYYGFTEKEKKIIYRNATSDFCRYCSNASCCS